MDRFLSKSKFKLGLECPTKLFYIGKKAYNNRMLDDQFLEALAQGGYQVGELAKLYYPGGIEIEELDIDISLKKTVEALMHSEVIVYEAAFAHEYFFVRTDILIKKGKEIRLIEVKAKSFDGKDSIVTKKTNSIRSKWKPYVMDVAFQTYVLKKALSEYVIEPYLLLVDKDSTSSIDGLNQKFLIEKTDKRFKVNVIGDKSRDALGEQILIEVPVRNEVDSILKGDFDDLTNGKSFENFVNELGSSYVNDIQLFNGIGLKCQNCEFYSSNPGIENELSGFHECWSKQASFTTQDFDKPSVFDLWNFRGKEQLISESRYFLSDVKENDFSKGTIGERQKLQIKYSENDGKTWYLNKQGLEKEFDGLKFPLHFIDFETTMVAIPFNSGKRPYELIAFQFSHHQLDQDGTYSHQDEWINVDRGLFPNYEFIRKLKSALEKDDGSIFRYADHENNVLCTIHRQLSNSNESDRDELQEWIKMVTQSTSSDQEKWVGDRNMIDMLEWVKEHYYHPMMKGSNSIKEVLPAILNSSEFLQSKYSKPIYGNQIASKNFKEATWIRKDLKGIVINPYYQLEPIHEGIENDKIDQFLLSRNFTIQEGGAAMIAYAKMQFSEMSETERARVTKSLLKYCELDTLSMVFIYEAWKEWINK